MASFQDKICWKTQGKRENKNCCFVLFCSVPTQRVIENSKKIAKKFNNTILGSFQAKIDWKLARKREYKIYRSVSFLPEA